MTNWNEIEAILGLAFSILIVALGAFLLVTAKDDVAATILGMVSTILGAARVFVYLGMLMGW